MNVLQQKDSVDQPTSQDARSVFLHEAIEGLSQSPKRLPSKYFYDARGSELFETICEQPEYYPTRTEVAIMRDHVGEMAHAIGPDAMILEFGSGSGVKTAKLLGALSSPAGYVAVEISRSALDASIQRLQAKLPHVPMYGVCADYTAPFSLPSIVHTSEARRVAYFPGSTLGNFEPDRAVKFLKLMRDQVGDQGGALIGIDLKKDPSILHAAYNDHRGVTAEFNRNVARRLRDELGAEIQLDALRHYAFYHPVQGRIEMHLGHERAAELYAGGSPHRACPRRDDPHRVLLQIHGRGVLRVGRSRGL